MTSLYVDWTSGYPVQSFALVRYFQILRYTAYFGLMSAAGHKAVLTYWDTYERDLKKGM